MTLIGVRADKDVDYRHYISHNRDKRKEGICASSGSACLADSDEPSHVIKAMKPESAASRQMIHFSLDVDNRQEEIRETVAAVQRCVSTLDGSY